jgi:hypothetical protein
MLETALVWMLYGTPPPTKTERDLARVEAAAPITRKREYQSDTCTPCLNLYPPLVTR